MPSIALPRGRGEGAILHAFPPSLLLLRAEEGEGSLEEGRESLSEVKLGRLKRPSWAEERRFG